MNSLPRVLIIGLKDHVHLRSAQLTEYETSALEVLQIENDLKIDEVLATFNPDSIITVGHSSHHFPRLNEQSLDVRRRWMHLESASENMGEIAYQCASNYILNQQVQTTPLISFFTPIYNTGDVLLRTYESVKNQTYANWEWVVVNDSSSDDGGKTLQLIESLAEKDCRIKVYDFKQKSGGKIGEVKYRAASLCQGEYLMELDHDDYLLPEAGYWMVLAFKQYPDCKFVYSDCAEIDDKHNSMIYGERFAFGYGLYTTECFRGVTYHVANTPNINPKTIRHIVGIPNHFRAWDRAFYHAIGGHNRRLPIADDYELVIRTFLNTKMVRIPKLLYLQYYHHKNTQHATRSDIQRRVRTISQFYNERIRDRFTELGAFDWAYDANPISPLTCSSLHDEKEQAVNYVMGL